MEKKYLVGIVSVPLASIWKATAWGAVSPQFQLIAQNRANLSAK